MEKKLRSILRKMKKENPWQFKVEVDWGRDSADVKWALSFESLDSLRMELGEMNVEYFWELEDYAVKEILSELEEMKGWRSIFEEISDNDIYEIIRDFIDFDDGLKHFLNLLPEIEMAVVMNSNYDCCTSTAIQEGAFEPDTYSGDIWKRLGGKIDKEDYLYELSHVYGGSLFTFVTRVSVEEWFEMKNLMKKGNKIKIHPGTAFGFHSSFVGASTPFSKVTKEEIILPLDGETKRDNIGILPDCMHGGYSMKQVFGGLDWIPDGQIEIIEKEEK